MKTLEGRFDQDPKWEIGDLVKVREGNELSKETYEFGGFEKNPQTGDREAVLCKDGKPLRRVRPDQLEKGEID